MIKLVIYEELDNSDEIELESEIFNNATSRFDSSVEDWIYYKVLLYNSKYNFKDYQNCPCFVIKTLNEVGKLIYSEDMSNDFDTFE